MRIYCSNHLKDVPEKLESLFHANRTVTHINTNDGVLFLNNNKIYRLMESKTPVKKTMIGVFPATIKSEPYDTTKECFQVPPHSTQEVFIHKVYKSSPESEVEYIFVKKQSGELVENYFSVQDGTDINRADVKADVLRGLTPN